MRSIKVNSAQANVLEDIAKRSKMDCWFKPTAMGKDGFTYYSEKDINSLMDGATSYDLDGLNGEAVYNLINVVIKCDAIKHKQ